MKSLNGNVQKQNGIKCLSVQFIVPEGFVKEAALEWVENEWLMEWPGQYIHDEENPGSLYS